MRDIREINPKAPPPEVGSKILLDGEHLIVVGVETKRTLTDPPRVKSVLVEVRPTK